MIFLFVVQIVQAYRLVLSLCVELAGVHRELMFEYETHAWLKVFHV